VFLEPIKELRWAYQLHFYICFRTRWRRNVFDESRKSTALAALLEEVCGNHDYHLLQQKVCPDHLRCLLSLRPDQPVSTVINKLKSNISREFCSQFDARRPLWATGYLARSVGRVRIQAVKRYLSAQSEHHGYAARVLPPVFRYRAKQLVQLSAAHAVFDLNYHLVLATHRRRSVFGSSIGRDLVEYWLRVANKRGFAIDEVSVVPDHIHFILRLNPKTSIQECALSLMNNGQDWMGKQNKSALIQAGIDSLWQPSAYAGTCGRVTTAMVKAFLAAA